jgi:putative drug exporter of the RND superfamily
LYISGVAFVGSLGLAAAIVVIITVLSALTLVPAFMGLIRGAVRALPARFRARKAGLSAQEHAAQTAAATQEHHEHTAFARWGRMVTSRLWPWAILSVAVLVVLAIPLFSITLGQPDNGTNPTSQTSRRAYDLISQGFGVGVNGPLTVVVKLPNQSSSANSSLLSTMQSDIAKTAGVASVTPAAVNSTGTTAVFNVIPTTRPQATQTTALVDTLRDDVLPKEHATSYVTGTTAGAVDFTRQITSRLPWLIVAVVAISFILLTVAFRSVMIAVKAAVLNILSIGAAYGVIVAIFEWGWGASLIGLHTTLPIPAYVPMLVFCIVFGLSMDYEVFLLSRVHEAWLDTRDAHRSVAIGIGATARVITTAAAIMIVVFTSFVIDPDPTVKMLAIGMAFAVLIDASLVRMALVPSIMALLASAGADAQRVQPNPHLSSSPRTVRQGTVTVRLILPGSGRRIPGRARPVSGLDFRQGEYAGRLRERVLASRASCAGHSARFHGASRTVSRCSPRPAPSSGLALAMLLSSQARARIGLRAMGAVSDCRTELFQPMPLPAAPASREPPQ